MFSTIFNFLNEIQLQNQAISFEHEKQSLQIQNFVLGAFRRDVQSKRYQDKLESHDMQSSRASSLLNTAYP